MMWRPLSKLAWPALAAGLGVAVSCAPTPVCGYGERAVDGVCVAVDTLVVDADQRTDGACRDTDAGPTCTFRRGIGVNACPVKAFTTPPDDTIGECGLFTHAGRSPDKTFAGDAGTVVVGFFDGPVFLDPSADGDCYDNDLLPSRDELFLAKDEFSVSGLGGDDFPSFDLALVAPQPLIVDRPSEATRGEDLRVAWDASDSDRVIVTAVTYDPDLDIGARITCAGDDDGEVVMDGALTAALLTTDDTLQIFVLRQNGTHHEPEGADVVVEAAATVSDVTAVPLR